MRRTGWKIMQTGWWLMSLPVDMDDTTYMGWRWRRYRTGGWMYDTGSRLWKTAARP